METQINRSVSLLLVSLFIFVTNSVGASGSKIEGAQKSPSHSETKASRCSYTFIVSQQKLTGALCLNTAGTNSSETVALRAQLSQQQERLRVHLEQEEAMASEINTMRQESITMNARITQLHAQVQNEILLKQDQAVEQRRMEELLVNTTLQVLKLSSSYRELEKKIEGLVSLVNNQSQIIMHMEKQHQEGVATKEKKESPPSAGNQFDMLQNKSSEFSGALSNVQRDQSSSLNQKLQETREFLPTAPGLPTEAPFISYHSTKTPGPWRDCQHVLDSGESKSGIYLVRPRNSNRLFQAWCEQSQAQGGWTVIQRRLDGSVNFFRTWDQYKQGFGNLDGEYWLGLESLFWLTSQASYKLRVLLEDWQGRQAFAEYDSFRIEPETDWYRLRLGTYQGTAGDSLSWHNNKAFTTLDRDKDAYSGNCAHYQKGGWWYHMCAHSNLNGVWYRGGHYRNRYQDGVYWAEFHGGSYSLKRVTMMIKPI